MENGRLVLTLKKSIESLSFELADGRKIKVFIKDHEKKSRNYLKIVIECPKDIKIKRVVDENVGNF